MKDVKGLVSELNDELKASRRRREELIEDLFEEDASDTSSFRHLTQSYRTMDVFSPPAVELVQRDLEPTANVSNGDIWPHQDSSPYAIHKIKALNKWKKWMKEWVKLAKASF